MAALSYHPEAKDGVFRCCRTRRFPYGIIYSVDDDEIFVAAVAHTKRKPGYWKKRLGNS